MNGEFVLLEQCSYIRSGQTFKVRLDEYLKGDVAVLLPKDIVDGKIEGNIARVDAHAVPQLERHLLKEGEIIVVNKGTRLGTLLYTGQMPRVIATTAFYVITPQSSLLPGYLNWYLNQEEAKTYLSANMVGSVIPTLTKGVLGQLPVPLIPLDAQEHILEFIRRSGNELQLMKELIKKKEEFNDSYIWEHVQKYTR